MYVTNVCVSDFQRRAGTHYHDCFEICLNVDGSGTDTFEEGEAPFAPGSVYLCPPGYAHGKYAHRETFKDIFLQFNDDGLLRDVGYCRFTDDAARTVYTMLTMINCIFWERGENYRQTVDLLAEALCFTVLGRLSGDRLSRDVKYLRDELIRNVGNPEYDLRRMDAGTHSREYLRKLFRSQIGCTPAAYLERLRIEHAVKLLTANRTPRYTVSDIAELCGYYDANYFTRVFKKHMGVSPREYGKK